MFYTWRKRQRLSNNRSAGRCCKWLSDLIWPRNMRTLHTYISQACWRKPCRATERNQVYKFTSSLRLNIHTQKSEPIVDSKQPAGIWLDVCLLSFLPRFTPGVVKVHSEWTWSNLASLYCASRGHKQPITNSTGVSCRCWRGRRLSLMIKLNRNSSSLLFSPCLSYFLLSLQQSHTAAG